MCKSCDMADDFYDWWEENKHRIMEEIARDGEVSFREIAAKGYYAGREAAPIGHDGHYLDVSIMPRLTQRAGDTATPTQAGKRGITK